MTRIALIFRKFWGVGGSNKMNYMTDDPRRVLVTGDKVYFTPVDNCRNLEYIGRVKPMKFNLHLFGEDWETCQGCNGPISDYRNSIFMCEKCGSRFGDCCVDKETALNKDGELLASECPICSNTNITISIEEHKELVEKSELLDRYVVAFDKLLKGVSKEEEQREGFSHKCMSDKNTAGMMVHNAEAAMCTRIRYTMEDLLAKLKNEVE